MRRRARAALAAAVVAAAAVGVVGGASVAVAGPRDHRGKYPPPEETPGMQRMHELMVNGNPGMQRMHEQKHGSSEDQRS
ncbi:MAG: hypothetical protein M3N28_02565 [Actinomycetota bacterium]|nr:hypothetical protein [Actinomycetota bacterium]